MLRVWTQTPHRTSDVWHATRRSFRNTTVKARRASLPELVCFPDVSASTTAYSTTTGEEPDFEFGEHPYMGPVEENEMFVRQLRRHGYETYSFSTFADRHSARWFSTGWTELHTVNLKGGEEDAEECQRRGSCVD